MAPELVVSALRSACALLDADITNSGTTVNSSRSPQFIIHEVRRYIQDVHSYHIKKVSSVILEVSSNIQEVHIIMQECTVVFKK